MTRNGVLIAAMLAMVVAYPIFMRVVANLVQPSRLKLADVGTELLMDPRLEDRYKIAVRAMLRDAYDPKMGILFACLVPIFAVGRALGRIKTEDCVGPQDDVGRKYDYFSGLHTRSIAAANPFFFLVVVVEVMFFSAIFAPLSIFSVRNRRKHTFDSSDLITMVAVRADRKIGYVQAGA